MKEVDVYKWLHRVCTIIILTFSILISYLSISMFASLNTSFNGNNNLIVKYLLYFCNIPTLVLVVIYSFKAYDALYRFIERKTEFND